MIYAGLKFSILPGARRWNCRFMQKALQKASGFIKQELAQEHILRVMPELSFQVDESWQRGERVADLLRLLHQETPPPMIPRARHEAIASRHYCH